MKLKSTALTIQNRTFTWGAQTYIMGILNVTPDSFSGDGLLAADSPTATLDGIDVASVIKNTLEMGRDFVSLGADILDVGGESTRPGSEPVGVEDELRLVIPVIKAIAGELESPPCKLPTTGKNLCSKVFSSRNSRGVKSSMILIASKRLVSSRSRLLSYSLKGLTRMALP